MALKHFTAHLLLVFFIRLSVHISEDLLVLGLYFKFIFTRQLCYLHRLLLVELIDYGLLLLFDEDTQLFLLCCRLLEFLLQMNDLFFALLEFCLGLGQVTLQIANFLNLEGIISLL